MNIKILKYAIDCIINVSILLNILKQCNNIKYYKHKASYM